jgi:MFS family permease
MDQIVEFFFKGFGKVLLAGGLSIPFLVTVLIIVIPRPSIKFKGRFLILGTLSSFGLTTILSSLLSPIGYALGHTSSDEISFYFLIFMVLILPILASLWILIPLSRFFKMNLAQQIAPPDAGTIGPRR